MAAWHRAETGYRLPTQAEWEYACRALGTTPRTLPAGTERSSCCRKYAVLATENSLRLRKQNFRTAGDCSTCTGNVWEWCTTIGSGLTEMGMSTIRWGRPAAVSGARPGYAGGGWRDSAAICGSAIRTGLAPSDRSGAIGFRVALSSARPLE